MEHGWAARKRRWGNRLAARASRSAPAAGGFVSMPEPRTVGFFARGRQITQGNFLLAGHMVETLDPWQIDPPSLGFAAELHGFGWMDHSSSAGTGGTAPVLRSHPSRIAVSASPVLGCGTLSAPRSQLPLVQ